MNNITNPYSERIEKIYHDFKSILMPDVTLEQFRQAAQTKGGQIHVWFPQHWLFMAEKAFNEGVEACRKGE